MSNIAKSLVPVFLLFIINAAFGQTFHQIGLSGGGATYYPAISPLNKNLMFTSCDMSGFYKSLDTGASWNIIDFHQINSCNQCYPAFDPSDPARIYTASNAVLKTSSDGGSTWSTIRSYSPDTAIYRIYIDPFNSAGIYAGTNAAIYKNATKCTDITDSASAKGFYISNSGAKYEYAATAKNIWRSGNDGVNWTVKSPAGPSALNSFCGGSNGVTTRLYCTGADGKVYVSINNGDNWAAASTSGIPLTDQGYLYSVVCAETNPDVAYAMVNNSSVPWDLNIYKTYDGGNTWGNVFIANPFAWQSNPPADPPGDNVTLGWQAYDEPGWNSTFTYGFYACRTDPNYVIGAGGGEVYLTTDGGATWNSVYVKYADTGTRGKHKKWQSNGLNVTTVWNYYIHPSDPTKHYICYTDIGLAQSNDSGLTWFSSWTGTPFPNTFYDLAFDPNSPGIMYGAGSADHDIPTGWGQSQDTPDYPGGPVVSFDYGKTWTAMSFSGLTTKSWTQGTYPYPCTGIAVDAAGTSLYITQYGDGVYKAVKSGGVWGAWTKLSVPAINGNNHFYKVKVHKDGTIFAGLVGRITYSGGTWGSGSWQTPDAGGVYMSNNGGSTWSNIAQNVYLGNTPLYNPRLFEVDPENSSIVYLCAAASRNGSDYGVYKTANGGASWTKFVFSGTYNQTYGMATPETISIDPSNTSVLYLSSNDNSLWKSPDGGSTWSAISFPFLPIDNVRVDPVNNCLYICSYGSGVWTNATEATQPPPSGGTTSVNVVVFPNPCNIAAGGNVKIAAILVQPIAVEIYNSSGSLVRRLTAFSQASNGYYSVWDGKNNAGDTVAQGIYLYSIITPAGKKTGKIGIIK